MTLHIGFSQHVETVLVAEVVEDRVVGVVGGTHGVDVQSFHGLDVLLYLGIADGTSVDGGEVVTVDTMEHHAAAIDGEGTVGTDAHLAESHLAASDVDGLALRVFQHEHEIVEVGSLCTPQAGTFHVHVEAQLCLCLGLCLCNGGCPIVDAYFDGAALHAIDSSQRHLHVRLCIGVGVV